MSTPGIGKCVTGSKPQTHPLQTSAGWDPRDEFDGKGKPIAEFGPGNPQRDGIDVI